MGHREDIYIRVIKYTIIKYRSRSYLCGRADILTLTITSPVFIGDFCHRYNDLNISNDISVLSYI